MTTIALSVTVVNPVAVCDVAFTAVVDTEVTSIGVVRSTPRHAVRATIVWFPAPGTTRFRAASYHAQYVELRVRSTAPSVADATEPINVHAPPVGDASSLLSSPSPSIVRINRSSVVAPVGIAGVTEPVPAAVDAATKETTSDGAVVEPEPAPATRARVVAEVPVLPVEPEPAPA